MKRDPNINAEMKVMIKKNEISANRMISRVMIGLVASYIVLTLLSSMKVFKMDNKLFYITMISSIGSLTLMIAASYFSKWKGVWQKYVFFGIMIISFTILNIVIGYKAWMIFALVVALSGRYYNKKFTIGIGIIVCVVSIAQSFANAYFSKYIGIIDLNMVSFSEPGTLSYSNWLHNAVLEKGIDSYTILLNSLKMMALPNCVITGLITFANYCFIETSQNALIKEKTNSDLLTEQMRIFNALAKDFLNVYVLDMKTGMTEIVKLDGYVNADLAKYNLNHTRFYYPDAIETYIEDQVYINDKDELRQQMKLDVIASHLENNDEYTNIFRIDRSGVIHSCQYRYIKIADTNSIIIGFQLVDKIVSQERERNALIEYSRDQLKVTTDIVSNAGLGIWHILLAEGKKPRMQANDKMREIMGITDPKMSEEDMYEFWYNRIVPEALESVQNSVNEMLNGNFSENTYQWNHPTKGIIYNRCGGTAKKNAEGEDSLSGYHADVTSIVLEEIKQKEALAVALDAAQNANRAKTAFLNNMSHDIRTPMNAIIGFTELASTHIDNQESLVEYLAKIKTSSQHLLALINDVLDMSKIESGNVHLESNKVSLPELINELRTIVQSSIKEKKLELLIDASEIEHEEFMADSLRLKQVLLNVLSNAVKFTPEGGSINVHIKEQSAKRIEYSEYEFSIKDTGIGMSKEFLSHIFESFSREQTSTVSRIQGTGLGMSISKNLVEMMNGTIDVDSEEGVGTLIKITLPLKLLERRTQFLPPLEMVGMHVLLVNDNFSTCSSMRKALSACGVRVEWTTFGKEAASRTREALDKNDPFVVYIVDQDMPDLSGIETVKQIKEECPLNDAMIVLTTFDWSRIEEEAREAGVTNFCQKPLFISEIRSLLVKKAMDKKEKKKDVFSFENKRILLVEDNELNREIATTILEEAGFLVDTAEDGKIAVDILKEIDGCPYDAILMDIQMPVMDGYEATRQIRELDDWDKANVPIIAMTANAFEEDKRMAYEAGMNGHLAKPINLTLLFDELSQILKD